MKTVTNDKMVKALKALKACIAATLQRFNPSTPRLALANALGMFNENGIETLLLDPASVYNVSNPWPGRYLLVQRGASGYQYGDLASGVNIPLGPSSDAPLNPSDPFNVRRLGARPGLELGVAVAGTTVTIDKLLIAATAGRVQDISTVTVNGTYWVVGRAAGSIPANSSTGEVPYVPFDPYQVVLTGTTLTFPANPA